MAVKMIRSNLKFGFNVTSIDVKESMVLQVQASGVCFLYIDSDCSLVQT